MGQVKTDAVFLQALDAAVTRVYRSLARNGVADEVIWEGLRSAVDAMDSMAHEVDDELLMPHRVKKRAIRFRHAVVGYRNPSRPTRVSLQRKPIE